MSDNTRQFGKIVHAFVGRDPAHDVAVVELRFDFGGLLQPGGGGAQSLQWVMRSDAEAEHMRSELHVLFGVPETHHIVGRYAWALRAFPYLNEPIVGVEVARVTGARSGQRLLIHEWLRRTDPQFPTPLEARVKALQREIASHARRISELVHELEHVRRDYADWKSRHDDHAEAAVDQR